MTRLFTTTHTYSCIIEKSSTGGNLKFKENQQHYPDRDFEMFFADDYIFNSQVTVGKVQSKPGEELKFPEYCAEISFVPEMFDFVSAESVATQ